MRAVTMKLTHIYKNNIKKLKDKNIKLANSKLFKKYNDYYYCYRSRWIALYALGFDVVITQAVKVRQRTKKNDEEK